ncbi:MAG: lipoate--protein ligase family protein [Halobacteriales archaeon]
MRVLRGRGADIDADRQTTADMLSTVAETGEPAVRVWQPHRQMAFGRRDTNSDDYEAAAAAARERGFPPIERSVGGNAVAYTGRTVAFARAEPIDDVRTGLDDRYEAAIEDVRRALSRLGVDAERGEPPGAFCPGQHSLSNRGKIAGIAQRIATDAAMVGGVVNVSDQEAIADVLAPVYDALGVAFRPGSIGSVARAGGNSDPEAVIDALETALVGDHESSVERVDT